jgi:hypothetical protein
VRLLPTGDGQVGEDLREYALTIMYGCRKVHDWKVRRYVFGSCFTLPFTIYPHFHWLDLGFIWKWELASKQANQGRLQGLLASSSIDVLKAASRRLTEAYHNTPFPQNRLCAVLLRGAQNGKA